MRFHITLSTSRPVAIPINHAEQLCGAVYRHLAAGDAEYARFVHDEGYRAEGGKVYKPFTFSWLRTAKHRRHFAGDQMRISPGPIEWIISSPLDEFLQALASGLLSAGRIDIGPVCLPIEGIAAVGDPEFTGEETKFSCLSPIVAPRRREDGTTEFIRPAEDAEGFSEAIRRGLAAKYAAIYGKPPADDRLTVTFPADYLEQNRGGTKKVTVFGTDVIGILAPVTISGSVELMGLGYAAGLGTRTGQGFGCAQKK